MMTDTEQRYILWGGALSVYTAKIRTYLIKKRIPYRELYPSHPEFDCRVMPALGLFVIPVLETPDGQLVQDTSAMIDYLEARFPEPCFTPQSPVQDAVATLICAFGSEGLNQPSMHYRWSFLEQHGDYIRTEFSRAMSLSKHREERLAAAEPVMATMQDHLPGMGIYEDTTPAIEEAYLDLLRALDEHFLYHPYLLGGRPSMADFGLMTGLYAHLSRDPVPSALMKSHAPNVFRWTERMHLANVDDGEFPDAGDTYLADDEIPETLEPVLRLIFQDWGPELTAATECYNDWNASTPAMAGGTLVSASGERAVHPSLGSITYKLRETTVRRTCAPQTLWHFDRAACQARTIEGEAAGRWQALLQRTGGESVMALQLVRPMSRENNVLVLV